MLAALLAQLFDDGDRGGLAFSIVLDVARPRADLGCALCDQALQRLGPASCQVGFFARLNKRCGGGGGNGKGLLAGGGGFLGATGNLLHRPPKLFGRRCRLADPASEFLAGSSDALFDLLVATARAGRCGGFPAGF